MKKEPLNAEHKRRLAGYDLANVDLRDAALLRFAPKEAVLVEGQPMEYLLFLVSGKAKVCPCAINGKDMVLCYYISEGIIGDLELMSGMHSAASTMIAITEFLCIGLPYAKYADMLKANLTFVNRVGRELATKLLQSSRNSTIIALHTGEERLCAYILQTSQDDFFSEMLTDVAASIGTSYRHLLRMLRCLCAQGVLKRDASGYHILNRAELVRRTAGCHLE